MGIADPWNEEAHEPASFVPFVDMLILLVLFLIASSVQARHYAMAPNRPGVPEPQPQQVAPKDLCVAVLEDGYYQIDTNRVAPGDLKQRLAAEKAAHADLMVFVDGDRKAPYGAVVRLEDICERLQIDYRRLVNKESDP